jgi:hypothetical protein
MKDLMATGARFLRMTDAAAEEAEEDDEEDDDGAAQVNAMNEARNTGNSED